MNRLLILEKKGVSTVVATVLLLLVTIALAGIVAEIVVSFTKKNISDSTACLPYRDYFTFEHSPLYNCYQKQGTTVLYALSLKTIAGEEGLQQGIRGLHLVFSDGVNSKTVSVSEGQSTTSHTLGNLWVLDSSHPLLKIPEQGEVMTFIYNDSSSPRYLTVQVYPLLSSKKLCPSSDAPLPLKQCEVPLS